MNRSDILDETIPALLIFEVGEMEFCTDMRLIFVVLKPDEINRIGSSGSEINDGYIQYNDVKYKLIDFNQILNLGYRRNLYDSRVILMNVHGKKFAFFVDRVKEIISLDKQFIEESIEYNPYNETDFITAILNFRNETCYLPDYDWIANEMN
jgi:chemotaxis signal transduction protein